MSRHDHSTDRRDESPSTTTTRRQFLERAGAAGFMPAFVSPSTFLGEGSLTPLALANPDKAITHGKDDMPSWYVSVDADSMDSLRDWADASDDRTILTEHAWDAATVKAPAGAVGRSSRRFLGGWASGGLQASDWVQAVDRNIEVGIPSPLELETNSAWDFDLPWWASLGFGANPPSSKRVAFKGDARETGMDEHKTATGADSVSVDTSGLTVAVVDTGVNEGDVFEDGSGNSRISSESKNTITNETGLAAVEDGNSHGSWVASCIAGRAPTADKDQHEGYLPDATILAVKALGDDGSGSTEAIAAGVEYAADPDAAHGGADLLCMSLGSPLWSQQLDDALAWAIDQVAVPVVAVGNDRFGTIWTASPADSEHAISVSATTADADPASRLSAYFANVGPDPGSTDLSDGESNGATPDLAAPGMQTTVLTPDTNQTEATEDTKSGTSMAAPMVAGCAGLLVASEANDLSFQDVRDRLTTHHEPLPEVAANEAEYGGVHARRAIAHDDPDTPQPDAMTDRARARSESYRSLSAAQGSALYRFLS